ncbi:DUF917 domain-containing protein [Sphaerisporangium flaviroseum]|uniref:DUF917 domain-containing protein n=1 Tax=Sphaerisporangium flaviroseum TaxID=509199 RepID=A0ABP7ILM0_9ACTN
MKIDSDDVADLAAGATLLGSGGGGDTATVALMLQHTLTRLGPVHLIEAMELFPRAMVAPIAATGSITLLSERLPAGHEFQHAVTTLGQTLGTPVSALMGFEVGGANALFAVAAAAWTGLPLIDADGMGRAFPRIDQVTFNAAGLSATPAVLADPLGNHMVIAQSRDNGDAERMLRAAMPSLGGWAATAIYPMQAAQAARHAITGSIRGALALGRLLRAAQRHRSERAAMQAEFDAELLFSGGILQVLRHARPRTGGTVTIEHRRDSRRTLRVEVGEEYRLAIDDGRVVAAVPDIICVLDALTWQPISAEHIAPGREVDVLKLPAPVHWTLPQARDLVSPPAFGLTLLDEDLGGPIAWLR